MTFKMWFEYSLKLKILFHLLKSNIFRFPKPHRGMVNRSTRTFSFHKIESKENTVDELSSHAFTNLFTISPEPCSFIIIKPEMMKGHNDGTPNRRNEASMVT